MTMEVRWAMCRLREGIALSSRRSGARDNPQDATEKMSQPPSAVNRSSKPDRIEIEEPGRRSVRQRIASRYH
jgi:hypothetical protein